MKLPVIINITEILLVPWALGTYTQTGSSRSLRTAYNLQRTVENRYSERLRFVHNTGTQLVTLDITC